MHAHGPRDNITDKTVKIPMCIIQEFGCTDGWIVIVQIGRFALLADGHIVEGKDISAQRGRGPTPSPSPQHSPESSLMLTGVPVKLTPRKYVRSAGLELPSDPIGCSPRGSAMKRPLYYLLCAIACSSMVSATMPMAAIAEAIQHQETAEQQAQADATSSDTDKAEDGVNTNATADTVEDGTATSTGASAVNTESADGIPATPGTAAATDAATTTPTPSLRTQTNPTPAAISATAQTGYAHSATATQNGVTFTVSWNDAPAGTATTFHVTQTNGSSQAKARMDVPTYWDGGSQESVCDPSRQAWSRYYSLGTAGHDFTFDFTASGTYRIYFYFMDNDRSDPKTTRGSTTCAPRRR